MRSVLIVHGRDPALVMSLERQEKAPNARRKAVAGNGYTITCAGRSTGAVNATRRGSCRRLLRRARELLGREINPTVYTPAEFDNKRAASDPFLKQVFDKQKLFVLGNKG